MRHGLRSANGILWAHSTGRWLTLCVWNSHTVGVGALDDPSGKFDLDGQISPLPTYAGRMEFELNHESPVSPETGDFFFVLVVWWLNYTIGPTRLVASIRSAYEIRKSFVGWGHDPTDAPANWYKRHLFRPALVVSFRGSEATAPQGGLSCPFGAIHLLGISWYCVR